MSKSIIENMTQRFLGWKLPKDFMPDGGISFDKIANKGTKQEYIREPSGTNLFNYDQAKTMVEYITSGIIINADEKLPDKNTQNVEEYVQVTFKTKTGTFTITRSPHRGTDPVLGVHAILNMNKESVRIPISHLLKVLEFLK